MNGLSVSELERNAQIAYRIKRLRAERGMTQEDLAQAVGVSKAKIAMIETGARTLTAPLCICMAEVLHCKAEEILGA